LVRRYFMKISVIIPTYNRKKYVERAIDSVINQTLKPAEVIVVDDGSDDNTEAVVTNKYPDVTYIWQQNAGVSAARNRGIRRAEYEWIALLDSDDEWHPEKLEEQVRALRAQSYLKICHTNEIWIKNGKRINQKKKHKKTGGWIYERCLSMCRISPSSVVIHSSIFEDIGLFDTKLPACEDYDMWLRMCATYAVVFVDKPLITKYGGHSDQLSQKHWGMDRFRIYALEKMLRSDKLTSGQRKQTLKTVIKKLDIYRTGAKKRGKDNEVEETQKKIDRYMSELEH